jgi:hypothetical protein
MGPSGGYGWEKGSDEGENLGSSGSSRQEEESQGLDVRQRRASNRLDVHLDGVWRPPKLSPERL